MRITRGSAAAPAASFAAGQISGQVEVAEKLVQSLEAVIAHMKTGVARSATDLDPGDEIELGESGGAGDA